MATTFKDTNGKDWTVKLDGPKIRDVRRDLHLDLAALDGSAMQRLYADPVLLVDALWLVCRKQATNGYGSAEFGEALVGEAIEHATDALVEAIADFSHPKWKELLRKQASQIKTMRDQTLEDGLGRLNDPEMTARILTAMRDQTNREIEDLLTQLSSPTNTQASATSPPKA